MINIIICIKSVDKSKKSFVNGINSLNKHIDSFNKNVNSLKNNVKVGQLVNN